ncbi:MAG: chorismate lyase [Rhodocyclaceae bacterium]|nr:chorismate lyase [Rhodocyclaceae bacterium]
MLPLHWKFSPPSPTTEHPLRHPGSLTARLARLGRVTVDVLKSRSRPASRDEAEGLGLSRPGLRLYVRRVCVRLDGKPAVLAESVATLKGVAGPWKGLRRLGNRPLAALLWSDPRIRRGPFQYARLPTGHPLMRQPGIEDTLPARRSCFWLRGQPLLVMEAFIGLPWRQTGLLPRRRQWLAEKQV